MVSVHLFSRIISSWFAFALPLFRSFQALQHRPASDPDIERLTKYWIVIGALLVVEYSVEFLISWFPFYWELKLLFLLFISLPQVQGSTYVYDTWLAPFLSRNEAHIDEQIESAQDNFLGFFQSQLKTLFDKFTGNAGPATPGSQGGQGGPMSSMQDAARTAMGFLTAHGISLAGKDNGGQKDPAGSSRLQESFMSTSSTSLQKPSGGDASHRSGIQASGSQASLPLTPEHIYQEQAAMSGTPKRSPSPAFPQPEHF